MSYLDLFFIFGAEPLIYIMGLLVLLVTVKGSTPERKALLLLLISVPVAIVLIKLIHFFYFEPRPFVNYEFTPLISVSPDASFPSRHTALAAVLAFSLLYFKSKWWPLFWILALWVGISRVYVGVHYWWDILGGFLIGGISLIIPAVFSRIYQRFSKVQ